MKKLLLLLLCLASPVQAGETYLLEVKGTINPGSASYVLEGIAAAEAAKADAVVIRLDTPGGLLASTRLIIQGISASSVPVLVWVSPGGASATSAGALIALSAHVTAMAPGTNIGAAHPVGAGGEEVKGPMGAKVTNDTAALARAQAVLRGRDAANAELIVTKSRSFSSEEAVNGRVADFVAADLEALLKGAAGRKVTLENPRRESTVSARLGSAATIARPMTWRQLFLHFISDPNVSAMLLSLAGLAFWAEVSSGFSSIAAGVIGVFSFVLAMVSLQTLPVNAGGALLLGLGCALLVLEAFVTSYGLLAIGALVSIFLGGLFLIDPSAGAMRVSLPLLVSIVGGMGAVLAIIGAMLVRGRHQLLPATDPVLSANATVATVENEGRTGTATVNGELWQFECSEGDRATPGETRSVAARRGLTIQLKRRN